MEWLLLIPALAFGLCAVLLVAVWLLRIGHAYLVAALDSLEEEITSSLGQLANRRAERAERRRMERRFAVAAGAAGGGVDEDAVAARKQIPIIRRVLDRDLPDAIVRCLRIHRVAAHAQGVRYIWEIADEPECAGLRARVVGLANAAMAVLERHPYLVDDELLMANLITLRSRIVPTCSECPYLGHLVETAPLLCPSAITARIDPERITDDKQK